MEEVKINIGCGPNGQFDGFDNIDNSPSVILSKWPMVKRLVHRFGLITDSQLSNNWSGVIRCDASKRLLYQDLSVDKIYTSHFLEHIPQEMGIRVLKECHRVLKKQGVMRIVIPDLLWHAEKYVERTRGLVKSDPPSQDRTAHDEFLETIYGSYLKKTRYGAFHCYMYDLPTMMEILRMIGFKNIWKRDYQQGEDMDLARLDNRPGESLHLEVKK